MRVLIVEDQREIADFIKKGLEAEHFAVDWAKDGEQGSLLAHTNEYDLMILDIRLPKKNGLELCRELREHGRKFPILMLSVESSTVSKIDALNCGADDYLTKPFSFEELLARARALLRRQKDVINEPVITIEDLTMDTVAHTVERSGKPIKLSRKEFALLEYLMRNSGTLLTRNMILEHVWDMNTDPFTNTVDVHIKLLREKVDKNHKRKLISTVHGYGYKLV